MATVPIIVNRQGIQGQQFPLPGADAYGAGIGRALIDAGSTFEKIQAGYDAAELTKLEGEGSAGMKNVLVEAKTQISDPEQYQQFTKEKFAEVYDKTLEGATSPQVRRNLEAKLSNTRAVAETEAKFGYFEKKKDVALSNALEVENRLADQAVAGSPAVRDYASKEYGTLIGQLQASGFLDPDKARARLEKFNDRIIGDGLALYARNNPLEFGDSADQGRLLEQYPGANATQIQRATEIADRTLSIRQARERQQLADESRSVKNSAYEQARNQQLSDQRIDQMAKVYQWTDDTAQELKRINRGLKEDSPYKEQLIVDAMEPLAKGTVSLNDVARAERNLQQLAGRGTISADSSEYRAAMNRIKNERRSLTISADIKASQADRQANQRYSQDRQRASDMLNREQPDMDPEERKKTMGTINGRLDSMRDDPAGRTKYLGEIEKQFQDSRKQQDTWKARSGSLRSIIKKP